MNNIPENKFDEILDMMKNRTAPEDGYRSVEDFKAEFFKNAPPEKKKILPVLFRSLSIAAVFLIAVIGSFIFLVKMEILESGKSISQMEPPSSPADRTADVMATGTSSNHAVADSTIAHHSYNMEDSSPSVNRAKSARSGKRKSPLSLAKMAVSQFVAVSPITDTTGINDMPELNTEEYKHLRENKFSETAVSPLSTFGADVDTAGYTNTRRFLLHRNVLPPKDAVRTEEFLNYFSYNYAAPQKDTDFHVSFESMDSPWAPERKLLLVGVQAAKRELEELPSSNFVFLIDNSGSMRSVFPMVIEAMETLAGKLRKSDRISIVTYGGGVNVLLDGGSGADTEKVKKCIRSLTSGGYTPGGAGIIKAYELAHKHFIKGGNNRIVLITDGDFNVGVSSESELVSMVEKERQSAIYLSAFGVGYGNYKDSKLKMLANKGNGNYSYLDNIREAKRVMTNEMTGKMFTLAKDVKFQIEFNPAKVAAYRLVGYELRKLAARDFNDDSIDSGEVGVGHQVTAVYELIMTDAPAEVKKQYLGSVDELKYQSRKNSGTSSDILTFKLRYQKPEGKDPSRLLTFDVKTLPAATDNIRWASAVTEFSMLLRQSQYKGNSNFKSLRLRAREAMGNDEDGKRAEFLTMVKAAEELQK